MLKQYRLTSPMFFLLLFCSSAFVNDLQAQLVVREDIPLQTLIRNYFIGGGAQVSNIRYTGFPRAIGYFDGRKSNIGIDDGVLMTTGWVGNAVGPNTREDITFASLAAGDPDLEALVGGTRTFDAAVLEFDFVPYQDSVTFEYVFGSDEYLEYVSSQYNDVFAFFISGPGFNGKENIALIPETTIPVSINTVNHLSNTEYFINNVLGTTIEYDGFTTVLKAKAAVIPCETYRLKLAIADVADPFYDSGVFLKAGSFDAGDALNVLGVRDAPEGGCWPGLFEIIRGGNIDKALTVQLHIMGTAVNGTDYQAIPTLITFQPGQETYVIPVEAFDDGIPNNVKTVTIYIEDICQTGLARDSIRIFDAEPLEVQLLEDQLICEGEEADLRALISGGTGRFFYQWNDENSSEELNIRVSPAASRIYVFTVMDSLTGCEITDSVEVQVDILPEIYAGIDTVICPYEIISIGSPVIGALTPYSVSWTPEEGLNDPTLETPLASPSATTTYVMTLVTDAGCIVRDSVTITVSDIAFQIGADVTICDGDEVIIGGEATGGDPPYLYQWTPTVGLSNPFSARPTASPDTTTTYRVVMRSARGCELEDSITVFVNRVTLDAGPDKSICRGSSVRIGDTATSASQPIRYEWSPQIGIDDHTIPTPIVSPVNSTTYYVQVTDGFGCVTRDSVTVTVTEVEIDAGRNVEICPGDSVQLQGSIHHGLNPFTWRWSPSSGLSETEVRNPVASPTTSTWYTLTVVDRNGCVARDSLLVTVWPKVKVNISVEGSSVLCEGETAILDAGGGYARYRWSTGETSRRIVVDAEGEYWVEAVTGDNCPAEPDTISVIVTDRPVPVITGPETACEGDSVRFTVNDIAGALTLWQVYGGYILDGHDTHSILVRWDTPGTYQIKVEQIFGSAGCRGDTTITVTVLPNPEPVIVVDGPLSFCQGESVRLEAASGFAFYRWSTGDTTSSIAVTEAGAYSVTVWNAIGCEGTSPPISVTVYPLPEPEIIALTTIPVCEGETVVLGLREAYTDYEWSNGERTPTIEVDTPGTFHVRVHTAEGCEADSEEFRVDFLPLPDPMIVADGPLEFCEGDSVRLRTTEIYAEYSWSNGEAMASILVRRSGRYTVSVRNDDGCFAESRPIDIVVHPLPPAPVITRPDDLLESTPAISWQWFIDEDGELREIPGATGRQYAGEPGVLYRVRITDGHGCGALSAPFRYEPDLVATTTVALPDITAAPGDVLRIPLTLLSSEHLSDAGVTRFDARIRFNESMLVPVGATPFGRTEDGECIISLQGSFDESTRILAEMDFVATLGTAESTPLIIEHFSWDQPDVSIIRIDGRLRMDVCIDGGARLYDASGRLALEANHPNPFNSMTVLTYEIIERGRTELYVLDMLGRRVATLLDGDVDAGRYRVHFLADGLPSGLYIAVLRTPTQVRMQTMKLVK